jgi:YlmC/YmxH family sporulation protein
MTINYQELKRKDVLEVSNGKNLGKINDLVIAKGNGKILKIIVPGKKGILSSCERLEIDYNKIVKIGDDAILVDTFKHHDKECDKPPCDNPCSENFNEFSDD